MPTVNFKLVETAPVALYSGLSIAATSGIITPYPRDLDGNKLAMSDFGTLGRFTVDSGVSGYEEIISFTSMTDNGDNTGTLGGFTRNLSGKSPYTSTGSGKQHGSGAVVVFSDNPQAYFEFGALRNDNSWTALNDFALSPTVPTPSNPSEVANKAYVDATMQAGGADMSTTVKGIGRTATSPNKTLGTATVTIASPAVVTFNSHGLTLNDTVQFTTTGTLPTGLSPSTTYFVISAGLTTNNFELSVTLGGTAITTTGSQSGTHTLIRTTPYTVNDQDTRLPTQAENDAMVSNNTDIAVGTGNKNVSQTGLQHGAELYAVISSGSSTAYVATLSPAPISLTAGMKLRVKIDVTNTTTTPTINFNGIGAKTFVKGISTPLAIGDLTVNMIADIVYDGTNAVLQNPTVLSPVYSRVSTVTVSASVTTGGTLQKIAEFSGLTGDTDDMYELDFEITNTQADNASALYILLNNDQSGTYDYIVNAAATVTAATAIPLVQASASIGLKVTSGKVHIKASKTIAGVTRMLVIDAVSGSITGTLPGQFRTVSTWRDVTNQLTAVSLYYAQTSGSTSTTTGFVTLSKISR